MGRHEQAIPAKHEVAQEVIYENRVDYLKTEHDRLQKAKDQLTAEIERKSKDYELFIAQKDGESKRLREDAVAAQEQLQKDKAEMQEILVAMKAEKDQLETDKQLAASDRGKVNAEKENIGHFIQALKRDLSVLGL